MATTYHTFTSPGTPFSPKMATNSIFTSPTLCSPKPKINLFSASPRALCFANNLKSKPISASLCTLSFLKMEPHPVSASPSTLCFVDKMEPYLIFTSPSTLLPLSKMKNYSILTLNPGEPRKISVSALPSLEQHNPVTPAVDGELVDWTVMVVEEEVEVEKIPLLKAVEVWLVPKLKYAIPVLIFFGVFVTYKLAMLLPRLIDYLNKNGTAVAILVPFGVWAFKSSVDAVLERREMKKTTKTTRIYKRKQVMLVPPGDGIESKRGSE